LCGLRPWGAAGLERRALVRTIVKLTPVFPGPMNPDTQAAGTPGPEPEQFYGSPGCPGPDNPNNSSPMPGAARKKGPEAATPRPDSRTNPRFPRK